MTPAPVTAPPVKPAGPPPVDPGVDAFFKSKGYSPSQNTSISGGGWYEKMQQAQNPAPANTKPESEPGYVGRVENDIASKFGDMGDKLDKSSQKPQTLGNEIEKGLNISKNVTGAAVAPIAELPGIKQISDLFGWAGKNVSDVLMKDPTYSDAASKLADFLDKNPGVGDALSTANNVLQLEGAKGGAETVISKGADIAKTTLPAVKEVAQGTKTINTLANAAKDSETMDDLVGQITQGKTIDIPKATQALGTLDTSGIKTYADLSHALGEKIKTISGKLDETLGTKTDTKKLPELTLDSKVGGETVSHNYVQDAISQLKQHYEATNDVPAAAKIDQLEKKANIDGLTIQEVNNLAKEHGQAINAFNANGQAASGLTKQAAENTRTGLKSTAREMFGDPIYNTADKTTSSLIRTKSLVDDVAEKVNALEQKIQQRGWGEKLGRAVGHAINLVGLNTPKGMIEYFLGRGTGLKTLNALDLEKALQKNLKSLQNIMEPGASESTIEKNLQNIIDAHKSNSGEPEKNSQTLETPIKESVTAQEKTPKQKINPKNETMSPIG